MSLEQPTLTDGAVELRPAHAEEDEGRARFVIHADGIVVGEVTVTSTGGGAGNLTWALSPDHRGLGYATRAVRLLVDWALTDRGQRGFGLTRVEALVPVGDDKAARVGTRSGLRREGVRRTAATGDQPNEYLVLARIATDPPLSDPVTFRALLNSFLPRKRGIGQMLVRDPDERVLLCQLTYKRDWDLPGGVIEVDESPRLGVSRELKEELAVDLPAGELLLTDWLPPWSGWDDAICLVFDGGVQDPALVEAMTLEAREIRAAEFCTAEQVEERCADFTARRIRAALARTRGEGSPYTESGRQPGAGSGLGPGSEQRGG